MRHVPQVSGARDTSASSAGGRITISTRRRWHSKYVIYRLACDRRIRCRSSANETRSRQKRIDVTTCIPHEPPDLHKFRSFLFETPLSKQRDRQSQPVRHFAFSEITPFLSLILDCSRRHDQMAR